MKEILDVILKIINGEQPQKDISELLFTHNCFYLLSMLKMENKWTSLAKNTITCNQISAREKMKSAAPLFEQADFPYAVIKGPVLSQMAYGNCGYRKSGDLDLLVSKRDWNATRDCLLQAGFVQGRLEEDSIVPYSRKEKAFYSAFTHQSAPFMKATKNPLCPFVNIDVNTSVLWGEADFSIDESAFLENLEIVSISGVFCKKLDPYHEFIALCLHHYKDMNSILLLSEEKLRLSLFCDIYFYLLNQKLDPEKLRLRCLKLGVAEYVYYCMYYAGFVFQNETLVPYLKALKTEKAEELIPCFGLNKEERRTWQTAFQERLFSPDFPAQLRRELTPEDLNKIEKNKNYL